MPNKLRSNENVIKMVLNYAPYCKKNERVFSEPAGLLFTSECASPSNNVERSPDAFHVKTE